MAPRWTFHLFIYMILISCIWTGILHAYIGKVSITLEVVAAEPRIPDQPMATLHEVVTTIENQNKSDISLELKDALTEQDAANERAAKVEHTVSNLKEQLLSKQFEREALVGSVAEAKATIHSLTVKLEEKDAVLQQRKVELDDLVKILEAKDAKISRLTLERDEALIARDAANAQVGEQIISNHEGKEAWEDAFEDWRPLECQSFLNKVREGKHVRDPNEGQLYARQSNTTIPFWINVHNKQFDPPRFSIWNVGYYYEKHLTDIFYNILRESTPNARVIDVGGNIGWFTLIAAASGHHVDVFEPSPVHVMRLCQSLWLNNWTSASESEITARQTKRASINLRPFGVGDKADTRNMTYQSPGEGTFVDDEAFHLRKNVSKSVESVRLIALDQMATELKWFQTKPRFKILKIDIGGLEPLVVAGAKTLLQAGLVENVLMEASARKNNTETIEMMKTFVDAGYSLYKYGFYKGPIRDPKEKQLHNVSKEELPRKIVETFLPTEPRQINLWWKLVEAKDK